MQITRDLLKRRAEHNDGDLSSLKEITLHQYDIEKIENIEENCKELEIIFLQNNQISRIENLGKLKCLKYLNLALNNITIIENLEGCESLEKLDLTVNFVEDPLCVESLRNNIFLLELHLVGNPCTQTEGYRDFCIATLPQLKILDGKQIEKSERIRAHQRLKEIRSALLARPKALPEKYVDPYEGLTPDEIEKKIAERRETFKDQKSRHTPNERLIMAKELDYMRNGVKKDELKKEAEPQKRSYVGKDGRILQCNEAKVPFRIVESADSIVLVIEVSKHLDTSFIEVDVHPNHVRVLIKGKLLQLVLDSEVQSDKSLCERSKLTGELVITMLRASSSIGDIHQVSCKRKEQEALALRSRLEELGKQKPDLRRDKRPVKLGPWTSQKGHSVTTINGISECLGAIEINKENEDFVDDPDVPPLC